MLTSAIAQAVNYGLLTAVAWLNSKAFHMGFVEGNLALEKVFLKVLHFYPSTYHFTNALY